MKALHLEMCVRLKGAHQASLKQSLDVLEQLKGEMPSRGDVICPGSEKLYF